MYNVPKSPSVQQKSIRKFSIREEQISTKLLRNTSAIAAKVMHWCCPTLKCEGDSHEFYSPLQVSSVSPKPHLHPLQLSSLLFSSLVFSKSLSFLPPSAVSLPSVFYLIQRRHLFAFFCSFWWQGLNISDTSFWNIIYNQLFLCFCFFYFQFRRALSKAPGWFKPIDIFRTATFASVQLFFICSLLSISSSLFQSLWSLSRHLSTFPGVTFVTFNISCLQEGVCFTESLEGN